MKTASSKSGKNCHFFKGVNPWFWSKIGHFSMFFFLGNIGQENVFYDILELKNGSLGYKNKKFKKLKNWDFSTHGFGSKLAIFPSFVFRQYIAGKGVLRYSRTKKRLSRLQKQQVQKVEKISIFAKGLTHGFDPKLAIFLEWDNASLGYKNKKFKKLKNWDFSSGG